MYVCMYVSVCVYACMYVGMHACPCVIVHMFVYYMYTQIELCIYMQFHNMHVYICTYIIHMYIDACMYVCMYVCTPVCRYIHIYICVSLHIYIYVWRTPLDPLVLGLVYVLLVFQGRVFGHRV